MNVVFSEDKDPLPEKAGTSDNAGGRMGPPGFEDAGF